MNKDVSNLKERIAVSREKVINKDDLIVFEPNQFDLFLDKIFVKIDNTYKNNLNNMFLKSAFNKTNIFIKGTIKYFSNSAKQIINSLNIVIIKFNKLEKKINNQEELILETIENNRKLSSNVNELKNLIIKLNEKKEKDARYIDNDDNYKSTKENFNDKKSERLKILQEENLRISSELLDNRKKVEIMKNEIEKYSDQRSKFIKKINSVNEIISDSNVLTSVFNNDINNNQINVLDPNKTIENKTDINQEVQNIFSKKNK